MESIKIILISVLAAIVYGIAHDQITARICIEYFTVAHPPIFATSSPTLVGLGWGIIATWWVGLILGIAAAVAAQFGSRPKISAARLIRPIGLLMAVTAVSALIAGVAAWLTATAFGPSLLEQIAFDAAPERPVAFRVDLWSHLTSYAVGFLGGVALCVWLLIERSTKRAA